MFAESTHSVGAGLEVGAGLGLSVGDFVGEDVGLSVTTATVLAS